MAVVGLVVGLIAGAGGLAFAYFTSSGSGNGSAQVGQASTVTINQLNTSSETLYSSLESPLPPSLVSQGYEATGTSQLGEQVTLASANQTLKNVVVTMESWTCQNWAAVAASSSVECTTTPGTSFNEPITFNIYNVGSDGTSVGSLITSDTQTFAIPYRPSATPATCPESSPLENGGGYLASDNVCHHGVADNITFSSFPSGIQLPANVIYGIAYSTGTHPNGGNGAAGPSDSLNVGLTTEPTQPTIGADPLTGTGSDYLDVSYANGGNNTGGGYQSNYCDNGAGGFNDVFRYDAGPCVAGSSGLNAGATNSWYIPAVEFNAAAAGNSIDLYPGGAAQPVDFSITNNGAGTANVSSVTFAINPASLPSGCLIGWFQLIQPTVPSNVTIAGGATVNFQPSGASISLINEPVPQNLCAGVTLALTFSSD
ncbi:MAG: hypothetical protein ABSG09_07315 [Acidimicrobiales bacterium]